MRRGRTFFTIWLVLLATLGSVFVPLLHDHAHGRPAAAPAVWAAGQAAGDAVQAQDGAATDADVDADACAVCAHYAGHCLSIPCGFAPALAPVRAPPPAQVALWHAPLPVAWLLPAPRAPPLPIGVTTTA